jgi:hypothetical protein
MNSRKFRCRILHSPSPGGTGCSGVALGPQDPKDVAKDTARDLSGVGRELASPFRAAHHWLEGPEYAALRHRLEAAYATAEVGRRPSPVYPPARFSSFLRRFFHGLPSFRVRRGLDLRKPALISDASRL